MKHEAMNSDALTTDINVFEASDGRLIAHAPVHGQAFYVDADMAALIARLKRNPQGFDATADASRLAALRKAGLFGQNKTPQPRTAVLEAFKPVEATLIFTENCNLGCTYCYASSLPIKSKKLSTELLQAAVDLVCENASQTDQKAASFRYIGGGEPTVEWALLEQATDYISQRSSDCDVSRFIRLITNGTLLTPSRVDWLSKNIDFITLSFDILPELQSKRPYANGASTQDKLISVVKELSAAGVPFHLRSTISAEGAAHLVEMVEYAHAICGPVQIRFEPMSEIGRSVSEGEAKPAQHQFVDAFKAAYRRGRALGVDVTCKQFTNIARKGSRFCDTEFTVTPEGMVSGCHRYSRKQHDAYDMFKTGSYSDGAFHFDVDQINTLRAIDTNHFDDCKSCTARWNCASGCLSARITNGAVNSHGPLCHLTRELLKFSIEETMKEKDDVEYA